jgi:hypothetical protein
LNFSLELRANIGVFSKKKVLITTKDAEQDSSKDVTQDSLKDSSKDVTQDAEQDSAKDVSQDSLKDTS